MPRARRSTPYQPNSRPRGTNPSNVAARLLRVSRRPSCGIRKQRVFVMKCENDRKSLSRNARNARTAKSYRALHIETISAQFFGSGFRSCFRDIGFSSRPRHIAVDIRRFVKSQISQGGSSHGSIQPPRPSKSYPISFGRKNVSFPRHVASRRPLGSGTATPSSPRTANMNALRLTVLAATIAYASAQQGTCEVCHLHYYHKVRPLRR